MADQRQQTIDQAKRELESIRLDAAAYSTSGILTILQDYQATAKTSEDFDHFKGHLAETLSTGDAASFTPDQARSFAERYTPVAAFDKEGAGIVFFKDTVTGTIIPTTRGTDLTGNALNDVLSDTAIAQNRLPTYQTTLLINFGLQVTAPEGTLVPQFRVVGITSSLDDAIAATMTTMLPLNPYANPQYEIAGYVRGTGQAVGTCVNSTGHSEAAPQAQVIGAILGCTSPNAYNGPGVSVAQMQGALDAAMDALHQPRVSLPVPDSLVIGSAGPSPIASANGGLPGQQSTLPIDWSINPLNYFDNHGVVKGMNAAELRLKLIEADPSIQTMAQANAALVEAQRPPGSLDALASLDPMGNYQPGMDTSAANATGSQTDNAAGGNVTGDYQSRLVNIPSDLGTKAAVQPGLINPETLLPNQRSAADASSIFSTPNQGAGYNFAINIGATDSSTATEPAAKGSAFNPATALPNYTGDASSSYLTRSRPHGDQFGARCQHGPAGRHHATGLVVQPMGGKCVY